MSCQRSCPGVGAHTLDVECDHPVALSHGRGARNGEGVPGQLGHPRDVQPGELPRHEVTALHQAGAQGPRRQLQLGDAALCQQLRLCLCAVGAPHEAPGAVDVVQDEPPCGIVPIAPRVQHTSDQHHDAHIRVQGVEPVEGAPSQQQCHGHAEGEQYPRHVREGHGEVVKVPPGPTVELVGDDEVVGGEDIVPKHADLCPSSPPRQHVHREPEVRRTAQPAVVLDGALEGHAKGARPQAVPCHRQHQQGEGQRGHVPKDTGPPLYLRVPHGRHLVLNVVK